MTNPNFIAQQAINCAQGELFEKPTETIELYEPSNSSDGSWFQSQFCHQCHNEADGFCSVLTKTFLYDITHPNYPNQWRYVNGKPTCTAFIQAQEDD